MRKLNIFNEKYQKLLDIYITPTLCHYYEDRETGTPLKRNIQVESIIDEKYPLILSGEPGAGKSTTLKRIGELMIKRNQGDVKKELPIFISVVELFDAKFDIQQVILSNLQPYFKDSIEKIFEQYKITLLIDSIDEFELDNQIQISEALSSLHREYGIKFILGTRSTEKNVLITSLKNVKNYHIQRFRNEQIEQFVHKFFTNQQSRADKLLDALRENRVLEKLPITPLSLSLISILFDENDLEIPATITDIYENFNSLLLGKAVVSQSTGFIDISFKERILSLYALELLKRPEHNPMTKEEFFDYFLNYFETKTLLVERENLKAILKYLIDSTGIIYLKNNKYVSFNHDSFMEFYAALEIFKHQRKDENLFIDNFFDLSWQNAAIFYGGKSKDMEEFLEKINDKLSRAKHLQEFFMGVNGAGYLLQALYQTNNNVRKKTIDLAIDLNLRIVDLFTKMTADDNEQFKSFKLPLIWLINVMYFYENFNSITLKEPLKLSFNDFFQDFIDNPNSSHNGYKAFKIAITLGSNRINESKELEDLIFSKDSPLFKDSLLTILAEICLGTINKGPQYKELKSEVKKEFNKYKPVLKHLLDTPARKLRFTVYDHFKPNKRIKIITEGKTDAEILEHAFMVLTDGESPYWNIKPAGMESGGADAVKKTLDYICSSLSDDEIIIGIFDHDSAGLSKFNGLNDKQYTTLIKNTVKKHKSHDIYAIVLPIPAEKSHYLMKEQEYNYFAIEHYFPIDYLIEQEAVEKTKIEGSIYKIKDSKVAFSKSVRKITDPLFFKDFTMLFQQIDELTGVTINYNTL